MIKNFKPRLYQETIFSTCAQKNTLVVLPTGLGKTNIFLMLAAQRLTQFPDHKILLLGPTRPLINQYYNTFLKHFEIDERDMTIFTGQVKPDKRQELWKTAKIIFSTPQGLENDIITGRIDLSYVSLLGFDEAHRAVGDYSYVWIAKQYHRSAKNERIIAMTASPGSDLEKITEVTKNLSMEAVEVRTELDPDVKPYIQDVKISWIYVELPQTFREVQKFLEDCNKSKLKKIIELGYANSINLTKRELLGLQGKLQSELAQGNKSFEVLRSISLLAESLKVQHALELLETQGITQLNEYMNSLISQARRTNVKAVKNLVADLNFRSAYVKVQTLKELKFEHPKLQELRNIIKENIKKIDKIIIFSQYRNTISELVDELNKIDGVRAVMFVGQAKKKGTGMQQKEQIKTLEEFKEGKYNVVVMSSVGEEGLDIPSVNMVVFYEPIPSAIRTIQRRGRTGRQEKGQVIVLVAKGTRDDGYRWASFHKEKRMYRVLADIKKKFSPVKETNLNNYIATEIKVIADYREKGSGIIKRLIDDGVKLDLQKLDIGDYLLSSRVAVEYKKIPDFVDSIIDKRLLSQVSSLKRYERPILLIEGEEDIYSQRKIHPNAIRGALATIMIDYGIPIVYSKNCDETAALLKVIAKREQAKEDKEWTMHSQKPKTIKEQQEYIVSSIPGIGPTLCKPILNYFKSIKKLVNAKEERLKKVDLIGPKKASTIFEILNKEYDD